MKKKLYLFIILCIHVTLATIGYLSFYISIPVSLVLSAIIIRKYTLKIDWSIFIHLSIFSIYLLNGKSIENLILLIIGFLSLIYSWQKQTLLFKTSNLQMEVKKNLVEFNQSFQEIRKERHDSLKHISTISYLLENNEIDEARVYMQNLVKRYEKTNLSLKGEEGAIAAILYSNYEKACSHNIEIHYALEVPLSNLPLPHDEIVQLLGNILDNSIDASIEWQNKYKKQAMIELSFHKKSGLYLLTCSNHTVSLEKEIADQLFTREGITTKKNHAGLGTLIIKQIIEKHNGHLDFVAEKQTFTLTCKIPNLIS